MSKPRTPPGLFALCIDNGEYPASLESRKLYEIVQDDRAASQHQLRVIDESGEDYLSAGRRAACLRGVVAQSR